MLQRKITENDIQSCINGIYTRIEKSKRQGVNTGKIVLIGKDAKGNWLNLIFAKGYDDKYLLVTLMRK